MADVVISRQLFIEEFNVELKGKLSYGVSTDTDGQMTRRKLHVSSSLLIFQITSKN
jgi:hypothetical protein